MQKPGEPRQKDKGCESMEHTHHTGVETQAQQTGKQGRTGGRDQKRQLARKCILCSVFLAVRQTRMATEKSAVGVGRRTGGDGHTNGHTERTRRERDKRS